MKYSHLFFVAIIGVLLTAVACKSKSSDPGPEQTTISTDDGTGQVPSDGSAQITGDPSHHFICPNRCAGSGGAEAGKCPVCGSEYIHNDAFHKGSPVPQPQMTIDPGTNTAVPTNTEAKNASGEYHFKCPNGDPGGAGVAGKCAKCGAELVHNQAFHNN